MRYAQWSWMCVTIQNPRQIKDVGLLVICSLVWPSPHFLLRNKRSITSTNEPTWYPIVTIHVTCVPSQSKLGRCWIFLSLVGIKHAKTQTFPANKCVPALSAANTYTCIEEIRYCGPTTLLNLTVLGSTCVRTAVQTVIRLYVHAGICS
jgi:hypothetical protein